VSPRCSSASPAGIKASTTCLPTFDLAVRASDGVFVVVPGLTSRDGGSFFCSGPVI